MNTITTQKKPGQLRAIFILNLLLFIICFTFYGVAVSKGDVGGIPADLVLKTAIAYLILFALLVTAIIKKKLWGVRLVNITTILVSIPATALIGMVFAIISLGLTFHKKVKAYFS